MTAENYYVDLLYPFQDHVLTLLNPLETGFYLSGGTALSRAYLNHRYSDDLDFFINDDKNFFLFSSRCIEALSVSPDWICQVEQRDERYTRLSLIKKEISLKIEFVNDVPSRVGKPWSHPNLGRIDTAENILANKVTAVIDREAAKDLADIWGLHFVHGLSITEAITGAQGKAAGIFPVDLARVLLSTDITDWELVRWIKAPDPDLFIQQLHDLGRGLIFQS